MSTQPLAVRQKLTKAVDPPDHLYSELTRERVTELLEEIPHLRETLLIEMLDSICRSSTGSLLKEPAIAEIWNWILSDERELPFSFVRCCQSYGVDPDQVRNWLKNHTL